MPPLRKILFLLLIAFVIFINHKSMASENVIQQLEPIQVQLKGNNRERLTGGALWVKTPYGDNIFVTNAHVVNKGRKYAKRVKLFDRNGKKLSAKVIAVRESLKLFGKNGRTELAVSQVADIAILEVPNGVPTDFAATQVSLGKAIEGIKVAGNGKHSVTIPWEAEISATVNSSNVPYFYGKQNDAKVGMSGTPFVNLKGEVIGLLTTSGHLANGDKLYVDVNNGKPIIYINQQPNGAVPLFGIATPSHEIQKFLDETYGS